MSQLLKMLKTCEILMYGTYIIVGQLHTTQYERADL